MKFNCGGLPLPYFLLLKIAQDIIPVLTTRKDVIGVYSKFANRLYKDYGNTPDVLLLRYKIALIIDVKL